MRRAKYSAKKVYLPNASRIGYGLSYAKPGNWVSYMVTDERMAMGRVLGRIDDCEHGQQTEDVRGWLAVVHLSLETQSAYVRWIDPSMITVCYEKPPRELFAWITGDDWPKRGEDVARIVAMGEHGSLSESYIADRDDPVKPYNRDSAYIDQFSLERIK